MSKALAERFSIPHDEAARNVRDFLVQSAAFAEDVDAWGVAKRSVPPESVGDSREPSRIAQRLALQVGETWVDFLIEHIELVTRMAPLVAHWRIDDNPIDGVWPITVILKDSAGAWSIEDDGFVRYIGSGVDDALSRSIKVLETIACWSGDRLLTLHAAGLALPDGRALALVGESGSGKTTLATALCAEGHALLSDDVFPVRPDGRVLGLQSLLCAQRRPSRSVNRGALGKLSLLCAWQSTIMALDKGCRSCRL